MLTSDEEYDLILTIVVIVRDEFPLEFSQCQMVVMVKVTQSPEFVRHLPYQQLPAVGVPSMGAVAISKTTPPIMLVSPNYVIRLEGTIFVNFGLTKDKEISQQLEIPIYLDEVQT